MSASQLSAVLFNALADEHFCQNLLTTPGDALTDFDLCPHELDALSSIRANTIEEFAAVMVSWLSGGHPTSRRSDLASAYGRDNGSSGPPLTLPQLPSSLIAHL